MKITSWGKYPEVDAEIRSFSSEEEAVENTSEWNNWIARGMGRSYGDSALSGKILSTLKFNRLLAFDETTGILTCESGVTYEDLLDVFVPKGWFPPVTPGTKFITIGGAIASDVHGKNHHVEGSFSNHLISFSLMTPHGGKLECSKSENSDVFWATCGGMGLTGLVLRATFKLKKVETAYIVQKAQRARNLKEIMERFEESMSSTYSVAWIDCLAKGNSMGRSVLLLGEHATAEELDQTKFSKDPFKLATKGKLLVPFNLPNFTLNKLTIGAFNFLFYNKAPRKQNSSIIHFDPYFYPLDAIHHWNRIYGKRGFTQYQLVLPPEKAYEGLQKILEKLQKRGLGSFLAVLKYFGKQEGMLSFPMEGYTLTLDLPINDSLFPFLEELDKLVLEYGGRVYLTKDCRLRKEMFFKTYPKANEFLDIRRKIDPDSKLGSLQSKRIGV